MTEREKERRRSDRLRLSVILGLCLILAVPVVVAMAASPDPSATAAASASAEASTPATTEAPPVTVAPVAPLATNKPSTLPGKTTDRLERGFGSGKGAITIAAISGSKLSLKTVDGWTRTITVTSDTTIRKGGQPITLADLDVGDPIRFAQKRNDDGTFTITAIQVPTPKAAGEVTAVSGNTLTIKGRNGKTRSITLNGSTLYKVGDTTVTKSAVTVGSKVTIQGTTSDDTFTAMTVHVQPTVVAGEVTAKTSTSLTLKRRDGSSIVVHVSADTKYRVRGTKTAGLADLAVGDNASAVGMLRSDGSLDAAAVQKRRQKGDKGNKDADPNKAPAASTTPG